MEKEQRWKVGDFVTYKSIPLEGYNQGGVDQGGIRGKILKYLDWVEDEKCWMIDVTNKRVGDDYSMLESEFEEWDEKKSQPKEFLRGEYIVILSKNGYAYSCNYVYKQREDYVYLRSYIDNNGDRLNGISSVSPENPKTYRYATEEEIKAYDEKGGPIDVTKINKDIKIYKFNIGDVVIYEKHNTGTIMAVCREINPYYLVQAHGDDGYYLNKLECDKIMKGSFPEENGNLRKLQDCELTLKEEIPVTTHKYDISDEVEITSKGFEKGVIVGLYDKCSYLIKLHSDTGGHDASVQDDYLKGGRKSIGKYNGWFALEKYLNPVKKQSSPLIIDTEGAMGCIKTSGSHGAYITSRNIGKTGVMLSSPLLDYGNKVHQDTLESFQKMWFPTSYPKSYTWGIDPYREYYSTNTIHKEPVEEKQQLTIIKKQTKKVKL